jgi:hypothetical protein
MADDGQTAEWDEVGRRFADLGRRLQGAWSESRPGHHAGEAEPAADTAEGGEGHRGVTAALDDLKGSISRTVSNPEVREAAGNATSGLTDALAANLRQLAEWIERRPGGGSADTVADEPKNSTP